MIIVLQMNAYNGLSKRILLEDYCLVDATPCVLVSVC